jgi:hypothetical protein
VGHASVIVVQRKEIKMNEIKMVNGFRCVECGDTYYAIPDWGYCDNSSECATSEGDSLKAYSWVADGFDLKYMVN